MDPLREAWAGLVGYEDPGKKARAFVQRILDNATAVRFELDSVRARRRGLKGRQVVHPIAITPQGEVDIQEQLIRAGYSKYMHGFTGGSQRFHDRYQTAQSEAYLNRRGRWGGRGPYSFAPRDWNLREFLGWNRWGSYYREPSDTPTYLTLGTYAKDSIDVIDADTFDLGLGGAVRFQNVDAPEMGDWSGVRRFNRVNRDLYLKRLKGIKRRRKRGWPGIRKSYPSSPGEFHTMKPRPEYGFPAGREQPWEGLIYHGTRAADSKQKYSGAASAGLGKWFGTDSYGYAMQYGKVHTYRARIANPYHMNLNEFRSFDRTSGSIPQGVQLSTARRRELQALGHDGIIVTHVDGTKEYILFDKKQAVLAPEPGVSKAAKARPKREFLRTLPGTIPVSERERLARRFGFPAIKTVTPPPGTRLVSPPEPAEPVQTGPRPWRASSETKPWAQAQRQIPMSERERLFRRFGPPAQPPGIKQHSHWASDFKGDVFILDIETQGHRTKSFFFDPYSKKVISAGRGPKESLMISEIAFSRLGARGMPKLGYQKGITRDGVHAWLEEAIDSSLLEKHGITLEDLAKLEHETPDKFKGYLESISADRGWGPKPKGQMLPGRWDPSVKQHGSVVNMAWRRLMLEHLARVKGEKSALLSESAVYKKILHDWSYDSAGKLRTAERPVGVAAWNVGYDLTTLMKRMREAGFSDLVDDIIKTGKVRPIEMAARFQSLQFNMMLEKPEYIPVFSNRAKQNAAVLEGVRQVKAVDIMKGGKHQGLVREYTELRELMNDFMGTEPERRGKILRRAKKWWSQFHGAELDLARSRSQDLVSRLSKVRTRDEFYAFLRWVQKREIFGQHNLELGARERLMEVAYPTSVSQGGFKTTRIPVTATRKWSERQILEEWYKTVGTDRHIGLFGDPDTYGQFAAGDKVMFAGFSGPLDYISGGGVEDAVRRLQGRVQELGISPERVDLYNRYLAVEGEKRLTEQMAHMAHADINVQAAAADDLYHILRGDQMQRSWFEGGEMAQLEAAARRTNKSMGDLYAALPDDHPIKTAANEAMGGLAGKRKGITGLLSKSRRTEAWLAGGALALTAIWLGSQNKARDTAYANEIDGIRDSQNQWDAIPGILPSNLALANLSAFQSGRIASADPQPAEAATSSSAGIALNQLTAQAAMSDSKPKTTLMSAGTAAMGEIGLGNHNPRLLKTPQTISHKPIDTESVFMLHPVSPRKGTSEAEGVLAGPTSDSMTPAGPLISTWSGLGIHREADAGYRKEAPVFTRQGMAGYTTALHSKPEQTCLSKVRDQATQLQRLPGLPRTYRGRGKPVVSHAEREGHSALTGARA